MAKPLLSIGIIFKNEIRCIERCLKSLQPLRDAIPCQLVMVDTGSDDGSREVAERYADVVTDFPWIDDFSAARNAAIDLSDGEWYLTIDCDEWLDENFQNLLLFFANNEGKDYAAVTVRNYKSEQLEHGGMYSDFTAGRLFRMSTGTRYEGFIHEHWIIGGDASMLMLKNVVLHHDGYVYTDRETSRKKTARNMALMKKELELDPDNLKVLMQCIESDGGETPEYLDFIDRGVQGVLEKRQGWKVFGPVIFRHAVMAATIKNRPDPMLEEAIAWAEEWFPESMHTRIDVQYLAMGHCFNKEEYAEAVRRGEEYFKAVADYEAGNYNPIDIVSSTLGMESKFWKQSAALFLAAAYLFEHRPERCMELLIGLDTTIMDTKQVADLARDITHLHCLSWLDTEQLLISTWNNLNGESPSKADAATRISEFVRIATDVFNPVYRTREQEKEGYCRHAYTVFLPLAGKCALGSAAQMLNTGDSAQLEAALAGVEDLEQLPTAALVHALRSGARFPLPDHPLTIEKMDILSARLAKEEHELFDLVRQAVDKGISDRAQELGWIRGLCMAALKVCSWKDVDEETGLLLVRTFAQVEKAYLPLCYTQEVLCVENLYLLPPLHRFGWYCVQAFAALHEKDVVGYVRLLREGLAVCESAKDIVEFLTEHTPELKKPAPSAELMSLAEQVRMMLAAYPANDPMVEMIKASDAYQKVADLIEGIQPPITGGLQQ